jgi:hypothetical protein
MDQTSTRVYSAVERRCTFFLMFESLADYRLVDRDERVWRREDKLGGVEHAGSLRSVEDIADNVISQLFGFTRNILEDDDLGLLETCDGGPEWTFTVDLDRCPYTTRSLEAACQCLVDLLNDGADFHADRPRVLNRSGNPDYHDPVTTYCDFDVPDSVRACLKRRGRRSKS